MKKTLLGCAALALAGALMFAMPAATQNQIQTGPVRATPAPALPVLAEASSGDAPYTDYSKWSQPALDAELAKRAIVERKVLMPMRDGVHLSTDIFRPKDVTGPVPTIFIRTPYNMQTLQGGSLRQVVEGVERGYAVIYQNERGRYFSEGQFEILGHPRTDGYDALTWNGSCSWRRQTIRRMRPWCRWHRAPASGAWANSTSRATGIAAACRARCSRSGFMASTIHCARRSRKTSTPRRGSTSRNIQISIRRSLM
jgi:X-Pro dipeptidyl-peptidase (S15 family)